MYPDIEQNGIPYNGCDISARAARLTQSQISRGNPSRKRIQTIGFYSGFFYSSPKSGRTKDISVSATFDKVADIIAETSEIDRDSITPESHTIDDLGIDSLDFLDIVFAIDKEFGIKIPLEKWTQEVNDGKVATEEYFVLESLCSKIDELRSQKA
jgi:acyl carrier protein